MIVVYSIIHILIVIVLFVFAAAYAKKLTLANRFIVHVYFSVATMTELVRLP